MTTQLSNSPRQVLLNLEGCILTENSLTITDTESFIRAGHALSSFDSCGAWFWSDYLIFAEDHGMKSVLESARLDLHRSTLLSYVDVGRFFPASDRQLGLSFSHHQAALYVLGKGVTLDVAKSWLLRAREGNWTVGTLREKIRESKREDETDPGPMRGEIRITDFMKLSKWSSKLDMEELPDEDREEIRKASAPLFEMLRKIHQPLFNV